MGGKFIWSEKAKAQIRAIDQVTALRILQALDRVLATGHGDVKQLQGMIPPQFWLRVGDYRVRFYRFDGGVEVISVKHRRDVYR